MIPLPPGPEVTNSSIDPGWSSTRHRSTLPLLSPCSPGDLFAPAPLGHYLTQLLLQSSAELVAASPALAATRKEGHVTASWPMESQLP